MKNIILIIIAIISFRSFALGPWGVDIGLTSTNYEIEGTSGLGGQSNDTGFEIGARYDYQYSKKIGVSLGSGFSKYASSYLGNDEGFSPSSGTRVSSIYDIYFLNFYIRPLVSYSLNDKLKLLGGLNIEKALKAESKIQYSSQDASFQNQTQDLKSDTSFLRFSLNFGISYDFPLTIFKRKLILIPRLMLQYALNDSYEKNGVTIKGSSIHIATGILF